MPVVAVDPSDANLPMMAKHFGVADFVQVPIEPEGPAGQCYWNCDAYVEEHGGSVVHGWMMIAWPGIYAALYHHAVVRKDDDALVDVSHPSFPNSGSIAFSIDESIQPPRDYPIFVENRFVALGQPTEAGQATVDAHCRQMRINRRLAEIAKEHDIPYTFNKEIAFPATPEVIELMQRFEESRNAVDRANLLCQQREAQMIAAMNGGSNGS